MALESCFPALLGYVPTMDGGDGGLDIDAITDSIIGFRVLI